MTFDDGPHPSNTPRLLDILRQRNIKATFYVVGKNVQAYPQIVARMAREGHEVANHTWTHPYITKVSDGQTRSELQRTAQAIHRACGQYPRTFRPPYGATSERHRQWIFREFGYPSITWNVDPNDWQKPGPSVVASRLVSGARPGAILLAHDIHSGTISAMPSALDQLLARGYRFVTVTQLINASHSGMAETEEGADAASPADADATAVASDTTTDGGAASPEGADITGPAEVIEEAAPEADEPTEDASLHPASVPVVQAILESHDGARQGELAVAPL